MSRFRRFLHLEKERAAPSDPSDRVRPPVLPERPTDPGRAEVPPDDPTDLGRAEVFPERPIELDQERVAHATSTGPRAASTQARFGLAPRGGPRVPSHVEGDPASAPSPEDAAPRSGAALERFASSPAAALRTDREAAPPSSGSRCAVCEREFGRFDVLCPTCGARLDSPQQLAFSQRLSEERAAHLAQEQAELERLRSLRSGADQEQRRALAEAQQALGRELLGRDRGALLADPWHSPSPFPGQRWLAIFQPAAKRDLVRLISLVLGFAWILTGLFASRGIWRLVWLFLGGLSLWAFFPRWWSRTPPTNGPPDRGGL